MQNTNVNGKHKVGFALRIIKGIGRRFAILVCKIAQIDTDRRAGDLTSAEIDKICDIFASPLGKYKYQKATIFGVLLLSTSEQILISSFIGIYRVRNPTVVLEQTEMHQGRNLQPSLFQHD